MTSLSLAPSGPIGTDFPLNVGTSNQAGEVDRPPGGEGNARTRGTAAPPCHTKLEWALDAVSRGFAVFPLLPNSKKPHLKNPFNLATTNREQIAAWWAEWPDANIGIPTEPYLVVDIDPRNGGDVTAEELAKAKDDFPLPNTLCSLTGGGGSHMICRLPAHTIVRGGAGKLGEGVDIKSWGGFIVAPGSVVAGKKYEWVISKSLQTTRPIADAPQWLIDHCKAAKPKRTGAGERIVEEDAESIERAFQYIGTAAPGAQKGNRGYTAYTVACRLYDFAVTRETCVELLSEWSEQRCDPPMDMADIEHAAMSAEQNMQNKKGAKHSKAPGFEPVEIDETKAPTAAVLPASKTAERGMSVKEYDDTYNYLFRESPMAEGPAREADALRLAAALVGQCRPDQATALMRVWNAAACEPELDEIVLQSALEEAKRQAGATPVVSTHATQPVSSVARKELHSLTYSAAAALALSDSIDPLIEDIISRSAMSVWYGESGVGKTFLLLDAAWHVAAGRAWGGKAVRQGTVVYVAAEGGQSVTRRFGALRAHYPDMPEVPLHLVPCAVDLLDPRASLAQLIALIKDVEARAPSPISLVVVDTLSRAFAGGNENESTDMGAFVANMDALRAATGAHVAIVHHTGKDKARGARGHSLLLVATRRDGY
jgi:hypothetical protein